MGTSVNRASPNTPSWQVVKAVLGTAEVPIERQSVEIWRAAVRERGERLSLELGNDILAAACEIASRGESPAEAIRQFERRIVETKSVGLTFDMAKRALARSVAQSTGAEGYARELFAEASSYYVSRDLPSFVAAEGRVATTSEAIRLKESVRDVAREAASSAGAPPRDSTGWRAYISDVLDRLQRGGS